MPYFLRFSEDAKIQLKNLTSREQAIVLNQVESSLSFDPKKETRNLKLLRPNPLAKYELRIGSLRVFFDVDDTEQEVFVLAVGKKIGNRLFVGGKEIKL
ncbi:MAG: type II toxin-antitoxin system RelE/ParE family toxin [Planctomycetes bacterium]|nr:type II toxin-antitoxin system RelE/ParE family toxin [Planctomycetota bacterium]